MSYGLLDDATVNLWKKKLLVSTFLGRVLLRLVGHSYCRS